MNMNQSFLPMLARYRRIDLLLPDDPFTSPILAETSKKAKDALSAYTSLFWKPRYSSTSTKHSPFKTRYFHIQAAPGGKFSPLIKKNPNLFQNIIHKVVQPADFYKVRVVLQSGVLYNLKSCL